ncbi:MAG: hypothetical protein U0L72_09515 [Acutalibacteraceae bacterium]|nr:hypothetical protein [Acutalibacteraceae bacterium]
MSKWIEVAETTLKAIKTATKIPYEFERWNEEKRGKMPDTFIIYFLVSDTPLFSADGRERSSQPRIQVSLYYRDISVMKDIPEQIVAVFNTAGFRRSATGRIPYQQNTGHYGWRSDFTFYEKKG